MGKRLELDTSFSIQSGSAITRPQLYESSYSPKVLAYLQGALYHCLE